MLVEELVLDGFKSYAVRTVVSSWDPQFNAITGLNGSGKSNILDAICFVLGITSMTTVRASNLQDLIYKRGQAGITKASVTITFDNSDKSKSPIGFDDKPKISITRQVILGGASKYLINGHKAQQNQVLNLFQSVQLNINNPNFLIMQGKITKMLNMKATEILGLVEEAAGTKMYENEKAKAENTMRKKNKKLQETEELLQEEVEPKLKRLTKQKSEVLEFQNIQQQLETLTKAVAAHDYKTYSEMMNNHETLVSQAKNDFEENKSEIQTLTNEITNLEGDLEKMKAQKQHEMNKTDLSKSYEAAETKITNEATRLTTTRDFKQQGIDEQNKKLQDIELQLQRLQNSIENKNKNYENMKIELEKSKEKLEQEKRLLQKKEDLLSTLSTGISSKGSTDGGYMAHLQDAKKKLSDVSIQMKQEKMKTQRLETEMNSNKSKVQNAQDELKKIQLETESRQRQIEILTSKLQQTGFDAERFQQLKAHEKNLRYELSRASQQLQDFRRLNPSFDFTYELPYPSFDTKSVKGLVGELFSLPAENSRSLTALEVCAGGRVFNVVVDTSDTGSLILDKGRLRKRVTIIPLDKISSRVMDKRALAAAKSISPKKVKLALDLVEYKDDVTRAMQYIFGNRLICDDPETAKKVTFDPSVRVGSITLDGDYYDPEGRLSGGSRRASSTLLMNFKTYQDLKNKVMKFEMELDNLFIELKKQSLLSETTQSTQHDLSVEKHQVEILQKQLDQGPSATVVKKQTSSIEDIERIRENIGNLAERASSIEADILSIEKDMKEFNSDGSSKLRELKSEVNILSTKFKAAEKELKTKQINFNNFQIENDQMNSDIAALNEEKELSINLITEFTGELLTINEELEGLSLKAVEISDKIKTEKERIMSINEELTEMSRILNVKRTNLYDSKLRLTKSQARYTEISGSFNELKSKLSDILRNNPWVKDERHLQNILSQNHGMVSESAHRIIDNLTTRAESMMKKGINDNIMTQIEQHEKHETALKSKIRQINKDKTNIEATIKKLDDYKRTELVKTYQKVSNDFGQIFSDLLPHAYAKLVPVSVTDVTKGLEVKVKLGNVWKESLVELSGGQRSLVALSLILSLLQFKPAPMYILDEVDAALDLSHTQNIGHLIKTRFKGSQFIVVSLKEGMFTNANRLFKVRFQEGTSVVTAT